METTADDWRRSSLNIESYTIWLKHANPHSLLVWVCYSWSRRLCFNEGKSKCCIIGLHWYFRQQHASNFVLTKLAPYSPEPVTDAPVAPYFESDMFSYHIWMLCSVHVELLFHFGSFTHFHVCCSVCFRDDVAALHIMYLLTARHWSLHWAYEML